MKQPGLVELAQSLKSDDPLDIVSAFMIHPRDVCSLNHDSYWVHRICALAELIVQHNKESEADSAK